MVKIFTLTLEQQGTITIPQDVINTLKIERGQKIHLINIEGTFIMTVQEPKVTTLTQEFESEMESNQISMNDLLEGLEQERQAIYIYKSRKNHA